MKKILALVMVLALVVCAFAAFAEAPSKQNPDIAPGGQDQEETMSLVIVENTEDTQKVIDTFKDAFDSGDVLAAFPEEVRAKIPAELTKINEMLSAKFEGDVEKMKDEALFNVVFETPYELEGGDVAFIFGKLLGEDKVEWTVVEGGKVKNDGSIDIILKKDLVKNLIEGQPFILAVVSK